MEATSTPYTSRLRLNLNRIQHKHRKALAATIVVFPQLLPLFIFFISLLLPMKGVAVSKEVGSLRMFP